MLQRNNHDQSAGTDRIRGFGTSRRVRGKNLMTRYSIYRISTNKIIPGLPTLGNKQNIQLPIYNYNTYSKVLYL